MDWIYLVMGGCFLTVLTLAIWRVTRPDSGGPVDSLAPPLDPARQKKRLETEQAAGFILRAWNGRLSGSLSEENWRERVQRFEGVPLLATRVSVKDPETCDDCRKLDGLTALVYSEEYEKMNPPCGCTSDRGCQCMFMYITADNEEEITARLLAGVLDNGVIFQDGCYEEAL